MTLADRASFRLSSLPHTRREHCAHCGFINPKAASKKAAGQKAAGQKAASRRGPGGGGKADQPPAQGLAAVCSECLCALREAVDFGSLTDACVWLYLFQVTTHTHVNIRTLAES